MPKRSNEFQRVVYSIQRALAPKGAKVTESYMTSDGITDREVDVLIEGKYGQYRLKIAVEAKDHARPLSVVDIESLIGKYQSGTGLKVNKIVVVSKSGFSRAAKEKADRADIELLTLKEATEVEWSSYLKSERYLVRAFRPPHARLITARTEQDFATDLGREEWQVFCEKCGRAHGSLGIFSDNLLSEVFFENPEKGKAFLNEVKKHGGLATILFSIGLKVTIRNDLKRIDAIMLYLEAITAHATAPFTFKSFIQSDGLGKILPVRYASASLIGHQIEVTQLRTHPRGAVTMYLSQPESIRVPLPTWGSPNASFDPSFFHEAPTGELEGDNRCGDCLLRF